MYTAGQLPFVDGALPVTGKVGASVDADTATAQARVAALNALAAVQSVAGSLDRVARVVKVTVFVASDPAFTGSPVSPTARRPWSARSSGTPASTRAARSAWPCSRWTHRSRSSWWWS